MTTSSSSSRASELCENYERPHKNKKVFISTGPTVKIRYSYTMKMILHDNNNFYIIDIDTTQHTNTITDVNLNKWPGTIVKILKKISPGFLAARRLATAVLRGLAGVGERGRQLASQSHVVPPDRPGLVAAGASSSTYTEPHRWPGNRGPQADERDHECCHPQRVRPRRNAQGHGAEKNPWSCLHPRRQSDERRSADDDRSPGDARRGRGWISLAGSRGRGKETKGMEAVGEFSSVCWGETTMGGDAGRGSTGGYEFIGSGVVMMIEQYFFHKVSDTILTKKFRPCLAHWSSSSSSPHYTSRSSEKKSYDKSSCAPPRRRHQQNKSRQHATSWHLEASTMGDVKQIPIAGRQTMNQFTKDDRFNGRLSTISENQVRVGGVHRYCVKFHENYKDYLSVADGMGFVFSDHLPCTKNIQRIQSIFLNRKGQICCRHGANLTKANLDTAKHSIDPEKFMYMEIDLDNRILCVWGRRLLMELCQHSF